MLDYETLDTIADAYVPILAACSLATIAINAITGHWRKFSSQLAIICFGLLVAYGLMLADNYFELWPRLGLDYSTHTAVAMILIIFLCTAINRLLVFWITSLACYVLLMLYQGYHSVADIVATALVVGLLLAPGVWLFHKLGYSKLAKRNTMPDQLI